MRALKIHTMRNVWRRRRMAREDAPRLQGMAPCIFVDHSCPVLLFISRAKNNTCSQLPRAAADDIGKQGHTAFAGPYPRPAQRARTCLGYLQHALRRKHRSREGARRHRRCRPCARPSHTISCLSRRVQRRECERRGTGMAEESQRQY